MTDRRVIVTVTLTSTEPTEPEADVLARTAQILAEHGMPVVDVRADAFDLDDPADDEATAYLSASPGGQVVVHADHERADQRAREIGGLVLELPVLADYRGEVTA